ncbi:transporter substrate-binding domain-containing protein [Thalassotalea sp. M1531]|uniref:Transporter substrate-binding domain-containing protein n=1 Tax=Thalassotalea algicola TaxID=2716224 RepID=A0A7Y0LF84_9GAMM|nr:transporter substrate-binding domain-containing protein [Thalassotalea algicola]NMP33089.1 transporter substrate-binding domain-containing protein [Thalassotalea algicola]
MQLYTEHIPPFQLVNEKNQLAGGIAHVVVEALMFRLQLKTKYIPLPWARAYKLTQENPNTLIYSIARSPQREDQFAWIGKIKQVRYFFYGVNTTISGVDLASYKVRDLKVVVVRGSIESDLLQQIGFEENKNLFFADSYPAAFQMALLGRVDAVYANQFSTLGISRYLGLEENILKPIYTINQSLDLYLAANKHSSREFIERLKTEYEKMVRMDIVSRIIAEEEERLLSN